jgi:hypothetical protein
MATIQEQVVVIKLSKLIRTGNKQTAKITGDEFDSVLEQVVNELVGDSTVIVEVLDEVDLDGPEDN